jgi:hypothetical protein
MDKNSKSVTSIFIVLALLALAALAVSVGQRSQQGDGETLLADLAGQLSQVSAVRLTGPGNTLIADIRQPNDQAAGWMVANADGYPVDTAKLRALLTDLAAAKIVETTTALPENYGRIGVADMDSEDASGILLELDGVEPAVRLLIGNTSSGNTTFVRRANEAQSWRVSGTLSPERTTSDWLNRNVVNLVANDVLSVVIEHADEETVAIEKSGTGYMLVGQPADRPLTSPSVLNSIAGALANVRFDAVRSAAALAEAGATPVAEIVVAAVDGLTLNIMARQLNEELWLEFSPDFDASLVTASAEAENESETETDQAKASAGAARAETIRDRVSGWAYRIPTFKSDWLLKRNDDLLQPDDA